MFVIVGYDDFATASAAVAQSRATLLVYSSTLGSLCPPNPASEYFNPVNRAQVSGILEGEKQPQRSRALLRKSERAGTASGW